MEGQRTWVQNLQIVSRCVNFEDWVSFVQVWALSCEGFSVLPRIISWKSQYSTRTPRHWRGFKYVKMRQKKGTRKEYRQPYVPTWTFQHRSMMLRNATCGMTAHCQSGSAHAPLVPCVKYTFKSIWYMVLNPIFCRPLNTRLVISISISFIVSNLSWLELGCQTNVFIYLFICVKFTVLLIAYC